MKSVLISTRPKWCEKICHEIGKEEAGKPIYEKRIEVRKENAKCNYRQTDRQTETVL